MNTLVKIWAKWKPDYHVENEDDDIVFIGKVASTYQNSLVNLPSRKIIKQDYETKKIKLEPTNEPQVAQNYNF